MATDMHNVISMVQMANGIWAVGRLDPDGGLRLQSSSGCQTAEAAGIVAVQLMHEIEAEAQAAAAPGSSTGAAGANG